MEKDTNIKISVFFPEDILERLASAEAASMLTAKAANATAELKSFREGYRAALLAIAFSCGVITINTFRKQIELVEGESPLFLIE